MKKIPPNIYAQVDLVGASARTDDKGEIDPNSHARIRQRKHQYRCIDRIETTTVAELVDKTLAPGGLDKGQCRGQG